MAFFYLIGVWKNKDIEWISRMKKGDYYMIIGLGFVLATIIEIANVHVMGRWGYIPLMPIIPVLNVGLVPIIQLMFLPFVVFWIVKRMIK